MKVSTKLADRIENFEDDDLDDDAVDDTLESLSDLEIADETEESDD